MAITTNYHKILLNNTNITTEPESLTPVAPVVLLAAIDTEFE